MKSVASMTGFANAARPGPTGQLTIELKSVNSRFLDLTLRVPDDLRNLEAPIREAIAARVARGKMECRLSITRQAASSVPQLNAAVLDQLAALEKAVVSAVPRASSLTAGEVLAWPGVMEQPTTDTEALTALVLAALDEALAAFSASREREGAALRAILFANCDGIDKVVGEVKLRVPEILAGVERKLTERLEQALAVPLAGGSSLTREEVVERIRQETTLYGLKMDVEEEIKRLLTHVIEVRRVLDAGGAVGRRLDFLMQELNREANTLGSKAAAIEMTNASVELKLLIEQMREQIQNLE